MSVPTSPTNIYDAVRVEWSGIAGFLKANEKATFTCTCRVIHALHKETEKQLYLTDSTKLCTDDNVAKLHIPILELSAALSANVSCTSLNLSFASVFPIQVEILIEGLAKNRTITELTLRGNSLNDAGVRSLTERVLTRENSPLQLLDISETGATEESLTELFLALKTDTSLTTLLAGRNKFHWNSDVSPLNPIAEMLLYNTSLTALQLYHTVVGDAAGLQIAHALTANQTLRSLGLECAFRTVGVIGLGEALAHNTTLVSLKLSGTDALIAGTEALARGLANNTTLTHLDLAANSIMCVGAVIIAQVLPRTGIRKLDLYGNRIATWGMEEIARAVPQSPHLQWLAVNGNGSTAIVRDAWYGRTTNGPDATLFEDDDVSLPFNI
jgi:hypothetical protein